VKLLDSIGPRGAALLATAAVGVAGCGGAGAATNTAVDTTPTPAANAPSGRPGQGAAVVGPAATKVKAAALAKYPGTIQDIQQQPDGSYVAHVIRPDNTEIHVLVSKAFKVTGTQSGPPGGGFGRPGGGGPGTPVVGPTAAKVKAAALAKYPGTIQDIQRLPDGSYVAHVIRTDKTEVRVLVSKAFKVTGTRSGPPGRPPAAPPSDQAPA
jgi:hypothetical protein